MPTAPRPSPARRLARLLAALLPALALGLLALPARAAIDPAQAQVDAFHGALLEVMKSGSSVAASERFNRLAPVVEQTFDLAAMTGFAVGPGWSAFTPADQAATIAAFKRLTVASYVHNFKDYGGEKFVVDPAVAVRGVDKVVKSEIVTPKGAPVALSYRMRESAGAWRIIDVYFGAISQLTTRRSDFAAPLAAGGAKGLIAHLNTLSDDLMK